MTPPRPSTPGSQTPAVSQLHKQLVHVNLKVDVLNQLSWLFGPFFGIGRSPSNDNLEVEPHDQKEHKDSGTVDHAF
jgi:hypothetical protein